MTKHVQQVTGLVSMGKDWSYQTAVATVTLAIVSDFGLMCFPFPRIISALHFRTWAIACTCGAQSVNALLGFRFCERYGDIHTKHQVFEDMWRSD
jgi:hypothetical protein